MTVNFQLAPCARGEKVSQEVGITLVLLSRRELEPELESQSSSAKGDLCVEWSSASPLQKIHGKGIRDCLAWRRCQGDLGAPCDA